MTSKEFSSKDIIPEPIMPKREEKDVYIAPKITDLPVKDVRRIGLCSCKAGEDNPY
ncbi:MAG: hypothetical protein ABIB61_00530 [Candidatus Shapirobacteria bacterium]